MFERRSLKWPITLGVIMIVLLVALTVGWIILAVVGALENRGIAPLYWTLLTVGTTFLVLVLVGVILYLALSIKAINLHRRQSNFIDSVTHELKSPIASLKLYLQTMESRTVSPEEQLDFFRFMLDDVERLNQLINHLLDAASLEKKPHEDEVEAVKVDQLLNECAEELRVRYRVPPENMRITSQRLVIMARRVDLDMVMRNLIDNALKYGGQPPQVEIDAEKGEGKMVRIRVADNGVGVPSRYRHKIFGRFVRLGLELERHKTGTGLGLYIVQTLVGRLRGSVKVRDRESGEGTVFELLLPGHEQLDHPTTAAAVSVHGEAEVV